MSAYEERHFQSLLHSSLVELLLSSDAPTDVVKSILSWMQTLDAPDCLSGKVAAWAFKCVSAENIEPAADYCPSDTLKELKHFFSNALPNDHLESSSTPAILLNKWKQQVILSLLAEGDKKKAIRYLDELEGGSSQAKTVMESVIRSDAKRKEFMREHPLPALVDETNNYLKNVYEGSPEVPLVQQLLEEYAKGHVAVPISTPFTRHWEDKFPSLGRVERKAKEEDIPQVLKTVESALKDLNSARTTLRASFGEVYSEGEKAQYASVSGKREIGRPQHDEPQKKRRRLNEKDTSATSVNYEEVSGNEGSEEHEPRSPGRTPVHNRTPTSHRKRRFWSAWEVENLQRGVEEYGVGNWSLILSDYEFDNRTTVDLKDKWRNMKRTAQKMEEYEKRAEEIGEKQEVEAQMGERIEHVEVPNPENPEELVEDVLATQGE